jgi:hypothetical protein
MSLQQSGLDNLKLSQFILLLNVYFLVLKLQSSLAILSLAIQNLKCLFEKINDPKMSPTS